MTVPASPTPPLDYAPRPPPWHRRKYTRRCIILAFILASSGAAYYYRYHLLYAWQRAAVALARYNCFHDSCSPDTVVYEEDPAAARRLIDHGGYVSLPSSAAGRHTTRLDTLLSAMDDLRGFKDPLHMNVQPGALVFMHERRNSSGQRLLVLATYALDDPSIGGGSLNVYLFDVDSVRVPYECYTCQYTGGLGGIQDAHIFPRDAISLAFSHPKTDKLRIFAGQPDPADPTRFTVDYEIAGHRIRAAIRILDPDPTSTVPTWSRIDLSRVSSTP